MTINDLIAFNGVIEGYKVHKQDAASPSYYLYANIDGNWYLMRRSISGAETTYKWRKQKTTDNYANLDAVWAARGAISGWDDFIVFK